MQLRGRKRWRLKRGSVPAPLRGATPHYLTPADVVEQQLKVHRLTQPDFAFAPPSLPPAKPYDAAAVTAAATAASSSSSAPLALASPLFDLSNPGWAEVVLQPGDCLYFPAGAWHEVTALDDSLSVNISLVGATWADVASNATRQLLWRNDRWRRIVSVEPTALVGDTADGPSTSSAIATAVASGKRRRLPLPATSGFAATSSSNEGSQQQRLYQELQGMLGEMQRAFARLKPQFLVPPIALASRPLLAQGVAAGTDSEAFSTWLWNGVQPGITVEYPSATTTKAVAALLERKPVYDVNPLAVLLLASEAVDPAEQRSQPGSIASNGYGKRPRTAVVAPPDDGASSTSDGSDTVSDDVATDDGSSADKPVPVDKLSYIVHVGYGNDELTSLARTVLHVPAKVCATPEWAALLREIKTEPTVKAQLAGVISSNRNPNLAVCMDRCLAALEFAGLLLRLS